MSDFNNYNSCQYVKRFEDTAVTLKTMIEQTLADQIKLLSDEDIELYFDPETHGEDTASLRRILYRMLRNRILR